LSSTLKFPFSKQKNKYSKMGGWDFYLNFLVGTLSTMTATTCIQPVDMVKVRI